MPYISATAEIMYAPLDFRLVIGPEPTLTNLQQKQSGHRSSWIPLPASDLAVGIDVGVTTFATFSDGTEIHNPRIYQNAQADLRRAQRKVSRRKKGSNRRRKAVVQLQKIHARNVSKRSDFLHQHSTAVVRKYGT